MKIGPTIVYSCPNCNKLIKKRSLLSGNTLWTTLYSNGYCNAEIYSYSPDLTKCKKCNSILWLSKLKEIGYYDWGDEKNTDWKNADEAEFLSIDDYFKSIELGIPENKIEELLIRKLIWWEYSHIPNFKDDELRWENNCKVLIELLDPNNIDHIIMHAELERNLGNFDKCIFIINQIKDENYKWIIDTFKKECAKQFRWPVPLKRNNLKGLTDFKKKSVSPLKQLMQRFFFFKKVSNEKH